jgi:hypothetical protein
VPETCRELKNRINKAIKSGASSWFSARNITRCTGNITLDRAMVTGEAFRGEQETGYICGK